MYVSIANILWNNTCLLSQEWENNDIIGIATYFILFISLSFNFLIFCYIGEVLVEEVLLNDIFNIKSFLPTYCM